MINILPFRFKYFGDDVLLVNEVGQFHFIEKSELPTLINNPSALINDLQFDLMSKGFLCEEKYFEECTDEVAIKLRTKKEFLNHFTSLHIIVLTQNCNSNCLYCHASSHSSSLDESLHMDRRTARKVCETILRSPSPSLKIEFQGGEPTLNLQLFTYIIEYLILLNKRYKKHLEFVLCTNLLEIDDQTLKFIDQNNVYISTSLDGPPDIHDRQRRSIGANSNFSICKQNIEKIVRLYGKSKISALMTITKDSLDRLSECVDTYISLGLNSIFFRPINPYGFAEKQKEFLGYSVEQYLAAYEKGLRYILDLNLQGNNIREEYATIFLNKILTPFSTGFVDIQSPPGNGIGCAVYDIDGGVYVSDEGRMLARHEDYSFRLGNVHTNTYEEMFDDSLLHQMIKSHIVEADPHCWGCPYIPYCGKDAVREYQEQRLGIEGSNCKTHKGIIDIIFTLIRERQEYETVFWCWVTSRPYAEVVL